MQPIAVEQDVVWYVDPATGKGRSVLAHGGEPTGKEPTIDEYFFTRVRPIVERALAANRRETWPVVYLHFNVRGLDPVHLQYIWDMLGRYESWLTTAERRADDRMMPLAVGPLMVLTEGGQDEIFYNRVPVGGRRVLARRRRSRARTNGAPETARAAQRLLPPVTAPDVDARRATNYRRWVNFVGGGRTGRADLARRPRRTRTVCGRESLARTRGTWRFGSTRSADTGPPRARAGVRATTSDRSTPCSSGCARRSTPAWTCLPPISTSCSHKR